VKLRRLDKAIRGNTLSETHQLEFNTRLGTACYDPLRHLHTYIVTNTQTNRYTHTHTHTHSHTLTHTHSHTLTRGMQQAKGQIGVVSVAQTQLAAGRWDAHVCTNTLLHLWAEGSDSGLRDGDQSAADSLERNTCLLCNITWLGFALSVSARTRRCVCLQSFLKTQLNALTEFVFLINTISKKFPGKDDTTWCSL